MNGIKYVQYGSGPRGLQSIIQFAKARALVAGRFHVSIADIKTVAKPALRHRILINYEGEAEGIDVDELIRLNCLKKLIKEHQSNEWGAFP